MRRRTKVVVATAALGGGGTERQIIWLLRGLDRSQYEPVVLLAKRTGVLLDQVPPDVRVHDLGRRITKLTRDFDFPFVLARAARVLRREKPDVLLTYYPFPAILLSLAQRLADIDAPLIVREGNAWGQYEHESLRVLLRRMVYPRADRVIANTNGVRDELVSKIGCERGRVVVIPNMVDIDAARREGAAPPEGLTVDSNTPFVVAVGRFEGLKGQDDLVEAFAIARRSVRAQLVFVGDGRHRSAVEELARRRGVSDDVRFLGFKTNPYAYIRRAAAFAHTPHYEGFGVVLLEALALGIPVVATAADHGPRELLRPEVDALMAAPGNIRGIADALVRALTDDHLRSRLIEAGKQRAEDHGIIPVTRRYQALFDDVRRRSDA